MKKFLFAAPLLALAMPAGAVVTVDGKGLYESGPIELKVKDKTAQITVSASFLLPDGRTVTPAPLVWTPDVKKPDVK